MVTKRKNSIAESTSPSKKRLKNSPTQETVPPACLTLSPKKKSKAKEAAVDPNSKTVLQPIFESQNESVVDEVDQNMKGDANEPVATSTSKTSLPKKRGRKAAEKSALKPDEIEENLNQSVPVAKKGRQKRKSIEIFPGDATESEDDDSHSEENEINVTDDTNVGRAKKKMRKSAMKSGRISISENEFNAAPERAPKKPRTKKVSPTASSSALKKSEIETESQSLVADQVLQAFSEDNTAVGRGAKKKTKRSPPTTTIVPEPEASVAEEDVIVDVLNESFDKTSNEEELKATLKTEWPVEDMTTLVRRIEVTLPKLDNLAYKSRVDKLNWDEIAFDEYTPAQCKFMWETIQKRLRRFRILKELLDDAKLWMTKPWTHFYRGSKTNRHPDMPKRSLSTYMIFYLKNKDEVLSQNPGLDMTELSKIIASMYKELSPKAKEKYVKMAHVQRQEYDAKLDEFYRTHPELTPANFKSTASVSNDNGMPKKPVSPFKMFVEDAFKRNNEGMNIKDFTEHCKQLWKDMDDKKKVFWINWASEQEAKYEDELKKYMSKHPEYVPVSTVSKSILTKNEKAIQQRMAGKPIKPPNSAYSLFSRLMLSSEKIKNVNPKERMSQISKSWKSCSDEEKKEYEDRVKHMLEQYKLQYAEYLESLSEDKRQEELKNNQPKKRVPAKKGAKALTAATTTDTLPTTSTATATSSPVKKGARKVTPPKKNSDTKVSVNLSLMKLFPGEPEPPPATPYLLFLKNFTSTIPGVDEIQAKHAWDSMDDDQRNFHKQVLANLKNVYIESYEEFLKVMSKDELRKYSEWKDSLKSTLTDENRVADMDTDSSSSDDESDSESDLDEEAPTKLGVLLDDSSSSD